MRPGKLPPQPAQSEIAAIFVRIKPPNFFKK